MIKKWWAKNIKDTKDSPGRAYSDSFFSENLSRLLPEKELSMLDIGCGSGYIRRIFYNLDYKLSYVGVDLERHKSFEQFDKYTVRSSFIKSKIEDFTTGEKFDLVFSDCALEHIEKDFLAVSKSAEFLKESGIQIHVVPTFWSLFLYLKHGYRRYTLGRLRRMFPGNFDLYKIGGFFSFLLHVFFITIPEVFFKINALRQSKIYPKVLSISNKLDRLLQICPSFYIIITKNGDKNL